MWKVCRKMRTPLEVRVLALLLAVVTAALDVHGADTPDSERPEEEAVLGAVEMLLEGISECDPDRASLVLDPEAPILRVAVDPSGATVSRFDGAAFLGALDECTGSRVERIWRPEVRVDGALATVWTPYDFRVDGNLSHCGFNAFDLVDTGGGWRIVAVAYSHLEEGCAEFSAR